MGSGLLPHHVDTVPKPHGGPGVGGPDGGLNIKTLPTSGYPLRRENRENGPKKIPVRENMGNLEVVPKHRKFGLLKL